ncbi:aminotransferase class III-fold pyridoxal phosphate-dependent enzyme [Streptomyces sp. NPDC096080]|uniref:aminotransferase class III-fold pyridoxal phosphate-dependent enzyme n=1 Tax=Streptomyces sp. NPDC096080 TaxID=3156693 RepID=UPI0033348437
MLPVVSRASGVYVYDEEGRAYLDGCSGAINVNLGHGVPEITQRMHEQIDQVNFVYRTQFRSRPLMELAERLSDLAPGGLNHVEFANSGSEGIEMALRLVTLLHSRRHNPHKCVVLTEEPSYHGMTAGALGASGHPLRRSGLQSLLGNQVTVARVRPTHGALRAGVEEWQEAIDRVGANRLAAVIVEPVGGAASGAVPCDREVLRFLRSAADEQRFVLVADEVMSGMGRTGRWFGCDHADIAPDVMVLGKGISAGYAAMSAVLVSDEIADALGRNIGSLVFGHTMAGAPLAAAASLAVTEYLVQHDLAERAATAGKHLSGLLETVCRRHRLVKDVRGLGLQQALGLHGDPERFPGISLDLTEAARAEGLLLYPAGCTPITESVLVAPPLTSTDEELTELVRRLDRALTLLAQPVPEPVAR